MSTTERENETLRGQLEQLFDYETGPRSGDAWSEAVRAILDRSPAQQPATVPLSQYQALVEAAKKIHAHVVVCTELEAIYPGLYDRIMELDAVLLSAASPALTDSLVEVGLIDESELPCCKNSGRLTHDCGNLEWLSEESRSMTTNWLTQRERFEQARQRRKKPQDPEQGGGGS